MLISMLRSECSFVSRFFGLGATALALGATATASALASGPTALASGPTALALGPTALALGVTASGACVTASGVTALGATASIIFGSGTFNNEHATPIVVACNMVSLCSTLVPNYI